MREKALRKIGKSSSQQDESCHDPSIFYAYVLDSLKTGRCYIGHTDDLKRRLEEHNDGKTSHTAKYRPWKVKCYFAFETRELAHRFELYLKSGSGFSFSKRHFE